MTVWEHVKAEAREAWTTFARWAKRVFYGVTALHVLIGIAFLATAKETFDIRIGGALLISGYGAIQGLLWALAGGVAALVLRLAGWGTLAPLILVPAGIWLSCHLGAAWVGGSADALLETLKDRGAELGSARFGCGHPILIVVVLPMIVIFFLSSGKVIVALLELLAIALFLLLAGAVAGALVSLPPLFAAIVARAVRRVRLRQAVQGPG